jgi:hypothetical protein
MDFPGILTKDQELTGTHFNICKQRMDFSVQLALKQLPGFYLMTKIMTLPPPLLRPARPRLAQ